MPQMLLLLVAVLALSAPVALHAEEIDSRLEAWTGDLDGMLERRSVRALMPYSRTGYCMDGGTQRGMI